ncbi:hypothetical protein BDV96DRAFT_594783 [Lophiotrema nucula]|uniref:Uncharacterized protein n=1 Tax=Lophiotrema nucula TaxID=690887 RepID=A0A6A5ZPK1_9PLEO|nr:hypothetical protein BDV96DRAFT_594783 [Lophiotrema nucula]
MAPKKRLIRPIRIDQVWTLPTFGTMNRDSMLRFIKDNEGDTTQWDSKPNKELGIHCQNIQKTYREAQRLKGTTVPPQTSCDESMPTSTDSKKQRQPKQPYLMKRWLRKVKVGAVKRCYGFSDYTDPATVKQVMDAEGLAGNSLDDDTKLSLDEIGMGVNLLRCIHAIEKYGQLAGHVQDGQEWERLWNDYHNAYGPLRGYITECMQIEEGDNSEYADKVLESIFQVPTIPGK